MSRINVDTNEKLQAIINLLRQHPGRIYRYEDFEKYTSTINQYLEYSRFLVKEIPDIYRVTKGRDGGLLAIVYLPALESVRENIAGYSDK